MVLTPEFIIAGVTTTVLIIVWLLIQWQNELIKWIRIQNHSPTDKSKLITASISIGIFIILLVVFKNPLAGALGSFLTLLYRRRSRELERGNKNAQIEEQAEVALQLITALYENNHDLVRSIDQAGDCIQPPLSDELKRTVTEYYAGKPAMESLKDFADRVNNRDIDVFVKGVTLSEQYGTDTSQVIHDVSSIMADRITLREELRNEMKGQSLTITIFLSVLPLVTIGAMCFPEMRQVLVDTSLGKSVITLMILMEYIAWHFTHRQAEVDAL
mgnify:CR=1 FL=1